MESFWILNRLFQLQVQNCNLPSRDGVAQVLKAKVKGMFVNLFCGQCTCWCIVVTVSKLRAGLSQAQQPLF